MRSTSSLSRGAYRPVSKASLDTVNSHPDPVGALVFFAPPRARYTGGGAFRINLLPVKQEEEEHINRKHPHCCIGKWLFFL